MDEVTIVSELRIRVHNSIKYSNSGTISTFSWGESLKFNWSSLFMSQKEKEMLNFCLLSILGHSFALYIHSPKFNWVLSKPQLMSKLSTYLFKTHLINNCSRLGTDIHLTRSWTQNGEQNILKSCLVGKQTLIK
jgi:hypothetical protein